MYNEFGHNLKLPKSDLQNKLLCQETYESYKKLFSIGNNLMNHFQNHAQFLSARHYEYEVFV